MGTTKQYTDSELESIANKISGLSEQTYREEMYNPEGYTPFGDE